MDNYAVQNIFKNTKNFFNKKRKIIIYLFFGVMTTIVNFSVLLIFNYIFGINEVIANTFAWIMAVTFAFFTNKYFVFQSKHSNILTILKEAFSFYSGRFFTLLIDNLFIFIFVSKMHANLFIVKVFTEFIIIILNYIIGKFIFSQETKNR